MNTRTLAIDFGTWTRSAAPTAEQMLCLYESDFLVQFVASGMVEDATNHWLKDFTELNPEAPISPKIVQAIKWARLYGDSIVVLLDKATDDGQITDRSLLAKVFSGKAAGMDNFHPLCDGDGYDDPSPEDLDALGNPKVFKVHIKGVKEITTIDASRCIVFKGKETRRSWRGIYVGIGSLDDVIDYRKWRATYGLRASKVAVPHAHWNKSDPNAEWSGDERTKIDSVEGVNESVVTTGTVTRETIGGNLTEGELDTTAMQLLNAVAQDFGVTLNDIFQHHGNGEKWAPDSNQTTYIIALVTIQKQYEFVVTRVLKAFGIKFNGWNSPWEEPLQQQIMNISGLAKTYSESVDPDVKAIVKAILVNTYGEKTNYKQFLATERANAEREAERTDQFLRAREGARTGEDGARNGESDRAIEG